MTIKVAFNDGSCMLFGDSYKRWWDQLREYYCAYPAIVIIKFEISKEPWISYGGLKWCSFDDLQKELDSEGNGRQASDFVWRNFTTVERNILKKYSNGRAKVLQ